MLFWTKWDRKKSDELREGKDELGGGQIRGGDNCTYIHFRHRSPGSGLLHARQIKIVELARERNGRNLF